MSIIKDDVTSAQYIELCIARLSQYDHPSITNWSL